MRKRERGRKSVGSHHKQRYHKRLFGIKGGKTFTKTDKTLLLGGGFEKFGFIEGKFFLLVEKFLEVIFFDFSSKFLLFLQK